MKKLLTSLIAVLAISNIQAQQEMPKLVVYITVDQLRGDYLDYFYNTFGERGFKRLLNQGVVYNNVRFEFTNIDQSSAIATMMTGSNPCFHGITGNKTFDFENNKEVSCLEDKAFLGNYTTENYSAKNLYSSTIGDELMIASNGRSEVYSIAPNPEEAILSAGHAANGAFWIDDFNGKWATTTYYKSVPWYVDRSNSGVESLQSRVEEIEWKPSMPVANYKAFPYKLDEIPFLHKFNPKSSSCYFNLKTSPIVNKEITRLAQQFIDKGAFGTRSCPDMLALTYYAGKYRNNTAKEYSIEIQDTYLQLDNDIERLLDAIDKKVGLINTLVVFTGTGYYKSEENYSEALSLSGGEFHPERCVALLNMYLMAMYGQKNWVKAYYNNQIFFDRKVIESAKVDLNEIQSKAAEFVLEFSGVQHVTTDKRLRSGYWNESTSNFRNGTHHLNRGDLIVELQPGWKIVDKDTKKPTIVRNSAVITPLIFMGNSLKPMRIYRDVKATEIAPTVSYILRIRSPNASEDTPLHEITKNQ